MLLLGNTQSKPPQGTVVNNSALQVVLVMEAQRPERYAQARTLAQQGSHVLLAAVEWSRAVDAALRLQLEGFSAEALHLPSLDAASLRNVRQNILRRHGRLDLIVGESGSALTS